MRLVLELPVGQYARVTGPLTVRVSMGQVMVLGAIYGAGEEFRVSEYRSYAIKALDDSRLVIEVGEGASVEKPMAGEEVLDKWVAVVDDCLRRGCRGFMVVGPTDSGKSSLAALIANRALLRGLRVGVVDADIGQADVGPPTTVSASMVGRKLLWLRELRAEEMRFIGYITPQRCERRIVAAAVELVWSLRRRGADVVVVDTDGWVQGLNALEYKAEIARFAGLDTVIVVGSDETLNSMMENMLSWLPCGVHTVPTPAVKRVRDRGDRRRLRSEAYQRYLTPLYERELDLDKVKVLGSCFFAGQRLPRTVASYLEQQLRVRVLAASETHDTVYVVTAGQPDSQAVARASQALGKQVYILDRSLVPGALAALVGEDGREKALALVVEVDVENNRMKVKTPYTGPVRAVILGGTRLTENFEETGRPLRCII